MNTNALEINELLLWLIDAKPMTCEASMTPKANGTIIQLSCICDNLSNL